MGFLMRCRIQSRYYMLVVLFTTDILFPFAKNITLCCVSSMTFFDPSFYASALLKQNTCGICFTLHSFLCPSNVMRKYHIILFVSGRDNKSALLLTVNVSSVFPTSDLRISYPYHMFIQDTKLLYLFSDITDFYLLSPRKSSVCASCKSILRMYRPEILIPMCSVYQS